MTQEITSFLINLRQKWNHLGQSK